MYEISTKSGIFCKNCSIELGYLDPKFKTYYKGRPENSNSYMLSRGRCRCFNCFVQTFGRLPVKPNRSSTDRDWMLDTNTEHIRKKQANTLENMIEKYGFEDGSRRYAVYCEKQAVKNTFEYKRDKFGWTKAEFDDYNKGRSVTLENMQRRYGDEIGERKFLEYCEKQKTVGCSLSYFQEKLGTEAGREKWEQVNLLKSNTLENQIKRYGIVVGTEKYTSWVRKLQERSPRFISNSSIMFFEDLVRELPIDAKPQFNKPEYCIYDKDLGRHFFFDFRLDNALIEFNGTYWHADPRVYECDDTLYFPNGQFSAGDIWLRDDIKLDSARRHGFRVMTVWENDVVVDKTRVIRECLKFLMG